MSTKGLSSWIAQLDDLASAVSDETIVKIAHDAWSIVTEQIQVNARTAFEEQTGTLFDPRSIITNSGVIRGDKGNFVYVEAGVFKDDKAMSDHGLNPKKSMPRSMVAYWLEFGTQEHYLYSGVRARNIGAVDDLASNTLKPDSHKKVSVTKGIAPTFFISRAYDTMHEQAFNQLKNDLNRELDKVIK